MEFVYGFGGFVAGAVVGVIFAVKIGAAVKSLETTIEAKLAAIETAIKGKL
jgi:hypothetical protein